MNSKQEEKLLESLENISTSLAEISFSLTNLHQYADEHCGAMQMVKDAINGIDLNVGGDDC